jgi:hypothetical protein
MNMGNMREISIEECNAVFGGLNSVYDTRSYRNIPMFNADDIIIVSGRRSYDSFSKNIWSFGDMAGYDTTPAAAQALSLFDEIKEWLLDNMDWLAEQFGYDLINPDHQTALNAQMNDKQKTQVGTQHFQDGTKWQFVDTADGVRYYDRNNDGKADLAVRTTAFGVETDKGDGSGWSMPLPN